MKPAIKQGNESKGGESADERGKSKNEVADDGADGPDEHGPFASDAVAEETIN